MEENINKHNPVDLFAVMTFVKKNLKMMFLSGFITMALAAVFVYSIPREYESTIVLAPEYSGSSSLSSGIGSLASMVGINMGNMSGEDAIYPEIYPEIISSTQFLTSLYDVKVTSADNAISCNLYDYYLKHQKHTWWSKIINSVKKYFKSEPTVKPKLLKDGKLNPNWLNKEQNVICKAIDNSIVCGVDKKTSIITLTYWSQDPLISMSMANSVVSKLQQYIIDYRTRKVKGDLKYMEKILADSKKTMDKAQARYAAYCDSHYESILQSDISERDKLETELSVTVNNFTQISQQVQMLKGKVQERTPSFTVVKNATVPEKPTKPKRLVVLVVFFMLGILAYSCYKYTKENVYQKRNDGNN